MNLVDTLVQTSNAERIFQLERRAKGNVIEGDFEGNVTGYWVGLDSTGARLVSYNKKKYITKPIGFTSLPRGVEVELSHANGVYYSKL